MMAKRKSRIPDWTPQTPASVDPRISFDICHLLIVILGVLLRLAPLGRYVTPDEPAWVHRAISFTDALATHEWAAVPVTGHPGVTTMWLGAIGVAVRRFLDPSGSATHMDFVRRIAWLAPENGEVFRHLASFLPMGRIAVAIVATLGLSMLYWLLTRLLDRRTALLAVGALAFDPFLIGHSALLHTDALLATFCLLALVASLNGLREPRQAIWWVLSGVFTGLGLLTKTPALILIPFIVLIILIGNLQATTRYQQPATRRVSWGIVHCLLFIFVATATVFALYPALWTDPRETLRTLFTFVRRHVETAQHPVFFAGRMTYNPGWAFYPTVFLFRISPVVLIGLAAGLAGLRHLRPDHRLTFLLLLAFAVGFGAMMSLGTKKHDRYLLPALPPLTLASAIAAERFVDRLVGGHADRQGGERTASLPFTNLRIHESAALALQALLALAFLLHPLTYFNPLVGGPWAAARILSADWGEGIGAAARELNQLPDPEQLAVASGSIPSFASLFEGRTVPLEQASQADYLVLGPHQSTNNSTNQLVFEPFLTITLGLFPHAAISSNMAPPEQAAYLKAHATQDDLILLDARTPLLYRYTGPGTLISVADLPDQAATAARLAGLYAEHSTLWHVPDSAASPITARNLRQVLDTIATPVSTDTIASTTITRYAVRDAPYALRNERYTDFDGQIMLIDAMLPDTPVNDPFPIYLRWLTPVPTTRDLYASLQLRDPARHLWVEVGQMIHNDVTFPTSAWGPGEWADTILSLRPPKRIPPGVYTVELVVTDDEGAQLGAWDADGQFQGVRVSLSDVEISFPSEPAGQSLCEGGRSKVAGPLLACMPEMAPQTIPSGDMFTMVLVWSCETPPRSDLRLRWRLVDAQGGVVLEQIDALSPYVTSRWRANDSFEVRYNLHIDPALPPARYVLSLNALAPDDHPLWVEDESLTTVEVLPRDRMFELPSDIAHPLDLTLGEVVHLLGFDLEYVQTTPGGSLPVTLYWRADGPTDIDYTIFVHLVGPDGHLKGQADFFPADGAAPTTSWARDQIIVDEIALAVANDAPAGTYHIAVGMYDAASGVRLPIVDVDGHSLPNAQATLPSQVTVAGDP